jgi:hypothetical protein
MKTYKALTALLLFAVMRSATFSDTVSLLPKKDNTLYEDPAGQLSNGHGIYLFAGKTSANGLRRGLIAFDLASIPTNTTITEATLSMFLSRPNPNLGPVNISLSRALRDWGEGASDAGSPGGNGAPAQAGDATWIHTFYNTSFWITLGGDFSPILSATTPVMQNATYTWSGSGLLADVQSWVSNPASNFGWVILSNEIDVGSTQRLNTRENPSNPPELTVTYQLSSPTPTPTPMSKAINLSTRMRVQTGDNVGMGGFIITGSTPKHVLLRAIGSSLTRYNIVDVLADPVLELHGPGAFATITNDNWRDTQEAEIEATGLPPTNDFESAIDATLAPGAYTAIVRGNSNTSGVALIEVYDLNQGVASKLANLSTRAFVGTSDSIVIAGFVLSSGAADRIVVRGIGPSLAPGIFPASAVLADPTLELRDTNGTLLIADNDWMDNPVQVPEITAAGLAPTNNLESAIAATLPPGLYTALLAGLNNGTGIGVVEIYDLGP